MTEDHGMWFIAPTEKFLNSKSGYKPQAVPAKPECSCPIHGPDTGSNTRVRQIIKKKRVIIFSEKKNKSSFVMMLWGMLLV